MARRKPAKPTPPADIAQRRAERRDFEARGLTVNIDPKNEEILSVSRPDCFSMLLRNRPEEAGAVTWLEALIRTASGENGQERRPDFIRASVEGAPGQNVSQTMIDAGMVLVVVTEALSPRDARMLFDLLKPDAAILTRWHTIVERCTGERNPQAQGAAVRAACANLVWVQANIDRLVRERRDRRAAA